MKILVSGGAGFIGSNLVDKLVELGHNVVVIDNLSTGKKENLNKKAVFYETDIINKPILEKIFEKERFEIVFHLAAQIDVRKSVEDSSKDAETNIIGSLNLLELSRKYRIKKFIFSSTGGAIYGDCKIPTPENEKEMPFSPYGCAKLAVEKYIYYFNKVFGLDYVILRYANVYGPRQNSKGEAGVVAIFLAKMINNTNPEINGTGEQTRDFVFVDDVVEANILALSKVSGVFNISTGKETSINEIFHKLNSLFDSKFSEKHAEAKKGEQEKSCLDNKKAGKFLS